MIKILFLILPIFADLTAHEQQHLDAIEVEIAIEKNKTKKEKDEKAEKEGIDKDKYDKYLDDKDKEVKKVKKDKKLPTGVDPEDLSTLHDYFDEVGK